MKSLTEWLFGKPPSNSSEESRDFINDLRTGIFKKPPWANATSQYAEEPIDLDDIETEEYQDCVFESGGIHHWKILENLSILSGSKVVIGKIYIMQCSHCGEIKSKRISMDE